MKDRPSMVVERMYAAECGSFNEIGDRSASTFPIECFQDAS